MGLAVLFVSQVFDGSRLESWARWLFAVNGVAVIVGVVLGGLGIILATMVSLAAWCITFPVAAVMVAVLFKRAGRRIV